MQVSLTTGAIAITTVAATAVCCYSNPNAYITGLALAILLGVWNGKGNVDVAKNGDSYKSDFNEENKSNIKKEAVRQLLGEIPGIKSTFSLLTLTYIVVTQAATPIIFGLTLNHVGVALAGIQMGALGASAFLLYDLKTYANKNRDEVVLGALRPAGIA